MAEEQDSKAWLKSHFWRGKAKRKAEETEQKTWRDTVLQSSEAGTERRAGVNGGGCSEGCGGAVGTDARCPGGGRESRDYAYGAGRALPACLSACLLAPAPPSLC